MKSIIRVVSISMAFALPAFAEDQRATSAAELEKIKADLKPLRQRAYLEADVIEAKRQLDDAYRAYWNSVRAAMARLEPEKKTLIEREVALRRELAPNAGGSRAEDYERKAAARVTAEAPSVGLTSAEKTE